MVMKRYTPNDIDRQLVSLMAVHLSHEQIAARIINERTGRPINRKTLERHYARELEGAKIEITNEAVKSWQRLIKQDHWPAVYLALRNGGVIIDEKGSSTTVNVGLKWTIHPVSPDNQVTDVPPITLAPTQSFKTLPPPSEPSNPPPQPEPPVIA